MNVFDVPAHLLNTGFNYQWMRSDEVSGAKERGWELCTDKDVADEMLRRSDDVFIKFFIGDGGAICGSDLTLMRCHKDLHRLKTAKDKEQVQAFNDAVLGGAFEKDKDIEKFHEERAKTDLRAREVQANRFSRKLNKARRSTEKR